MFTWSSENVRRNLRPEIALPEGINFTSSMSSKRQAVCSIILCWRRWLSDARRGQRRKQRKNMLALTEGAMKRKRLEYLFSTSLIIKLTVVEVAWRTSLWLWQDVKYIEQRWASRMPCFQPVNVMDHQVVTMRKKTTTRPACKEMATVCEEKASRDWKHGWNSCAGCVATSQQIQELHTHTENSSDLSSLGGFAEPGDPQF